MWFRDIRILPYMLLINPSAWQPALYIQKHYNMLYINKYVRVLHQCCLYTYKKIIIHVAASPPLPCSRCYTYYNITLQHVVRVYIYIHVPTCIYIHVGTEWLTRACEREREREGARERERARKRKGGLTSQSILVLSNPQPVDEGQLSLQRNNFQLFQSHLLHGHFLLPRRLLQFPLQTNHPLSQYLNFIP